MKQPASVNDMNESLRVPASAVAQIGKTELEKAPELKNAQKKLKREIQYFDDSTTVSAKGYSDPGTGAREGTWRFYYETGEVKEKGKYKAGQKTGQWITLSQEQDTVGCVSYTENGDTVGCEE